MEFFTKTTAIKLRSHLNKYLVAAAESSSGDVEEDAHRETVRQSRRGAHSTASTWKVERVEGRSHVIRLRSSRGGYLAASDAPFLLGMTGNKVVVTAPDYDPSLGSDRMIEWEPIRDGFQVMLRSWCGKYLRANGGTPPWRNSVTHDEPSMGSTKRWILWDVEEVGEAEIKGGRSERSAVEDYLSNMSSFSSVPEDVLSALGSEGGGSPRRSSNLPQSNLPSIQLSRHSSNLQLPRSGMDFFHNAKTVRLRSHHRKYLLADEDEESVAQDRKGSSKNAKWNVEFVASDVGSEAGSTFIRLRSCYNRYLTASNKAFLLGMTGCKVLQTLPNRLDSSVEWEPVREGNRVKLRTRYGNFLRANGGVPPWRNSVTHDFPHTSVTQDWILWEVDIIEIEVRSPGGREQPVLMQPPPLDGELIASETSFSSSVSENSGKFSRQESSDSLVGSPLPPPSPTPNPRMIEGKIIYYHIADENGEVEGEDMEGYCLPNFKGNSVAELSRKLAEETGMESIIVCSRSPLNGKLFPLRLQLPPNVIMHVVVVPSASTVVSDFARQGTF